MKVLKHAEIMNVNGGFADGIGARLGSGLATSFFVLGGLAVLGISLSIGFGMAALYEKNNKPQ